MTANSGLNSGRKSENRGNTGAKAHFIEESPATALAAWRILRGRAN